MSLNETLPLNPASVMKLVTTYAGLEILGPAYRWKTEAYAAGPVANDVLAGDLVLKGYGDPKLVLEDFWLLLKNIRERGVREVRGDPLGREPRRQQRQPLGPARDDADVRLVALDLPSDGGVGQ